MNKSKKTIKQFTEVLERSQKPNNSAIAVGFSGDQSYVNGIAPHPIKPHFALLNSNIDDKKVFQFWTPLKKSGNNSSILALDFSKSSGVPVLYYRFEENSKLKHLKFDNKSKLNKDEFIFFYAELGHFSFFYSMFKEAKTDKCIIEFQSNNKVNSKLFYRQMLRAFVNPAQFEEIQSALLAFDESLVNAEGEIYDEI